MIASDKTFIKNHLEKNEPLAPENEQKIEKAGKVEKIFSALGGALITYAASSSLHNKERNWLHYGAAIVGGILTLRGFKSFLPKKWSSEQNTSSSSKVSN